MKTINIFVIILLMCISDVKGIPLNVTCPADFDLYQNHCFHISKGRGTWKDARNHCHKIGGNQTWIDGDLKETNVEDYLKANLAKLYRPTPFVWLPKIIPQGHGKNFVWQDSGTNATGYLNKHGYYRGKFLTETSSLKLYMNQFGYAFHCSTKCWHLPAFCEVNPVNKSLPVNESPPGNETRVNPLVKEISTLQPGKNASLDCPAGFDSYRKYCFYISSGVGTNEFAANVCKKIGGYQPMINGVTKEYVVKGYLRAYGKKINNHKRYVWLPRIVSKGNFITWKHSGRNANSFIRRYRLNPRLFKPNRRGDLMISLSGHVRHCTYCHNVQAFCETDNLDKNRWKSPFEKYVKNRKVHTSPKKKGKHHIKNASKNNKQHKRIDKKGKGETGQKTEKENHKNESSTKKKHASHHKKTHQAKCPDGFDLFRKHCFYIGRRKESIRNTKATCKKIKGFQVDIAGPVKEHTVLQYIKAKRIRIMYPRPYLWLSTAVGDGHSLTWMDSGKNAKYFLKKNRFYRRKFYTKRYFEKEVYIHPSGRIGSCLGECKRKLLQPFCETTLLAGNKTTT